MHNGPPPKFYGTRDNLGRVSCSGHSRCGGDRPGGWGAGLISLSPPRGEDQVGSEGLCSGGASQGRAVYAARAVVVAPAGAKGLLAVSMCRIASVSLRAMSTRGDRGSALAAQPDLGALVAVPVDGVPSGVGGRF